MGLMDFLKKRSDSGLGAEASTFDTGMDFKMNDPATNPDFAQHQNPLNDYPSSMSGMNTFSQASQPQAPVRDISKDIELISAKLDAVKSELDAMNQRLRNIEMIAEQQSKPKKWY